MALESGGVVFDAGQVPACLAERPQWLVWRFESKPGEKKPRKVPYYVSGKRRTGEQGAAPDRAALVQLAAALAALEKSATLKSPWSGVGFAFLPGDGLVGIDLDGMIDAAGEMSARGTAIIQACASYTEFSPSGKGVHIICGGETETFKSNEVGVEVFCGRQYFTFTGRRYPDTPASVEPLPEKALKRLKATVESGRKRAADGKPSTSPAPALEGRAKVESALAYISPDCGYEDWIQIGMAICSELGPGAGDVWDAWSAKAGKYPGRRQVEQHWKSFKPGEGVTGATLFKRAMESGWSPPKAPRKRAQPGKGEKPAGDGAADAPEWRKSLIFDRGELKACLANVYDILIHDLTWRGVLAFDEFALRTVKLKPTPFGSAAGEWDQTDDSRAAMWLARKYRFTPSTALVAEAVEVAARANTVHPPRDWLRTLTWDKRPRLGTWIARFLGAQQSEYSERVGAWFLMGMIARVMRPGSKFDYCLVLEGDQGKRKSSILAAMGGQWFGDTDINLGDKDSMTALQGKWLHEFAELGSLARSEELRQKSFLSRQFDDYRPVYGRRFIRAPRQNVFAGSTNQWEWNKDPTGGRRFWPIEVAVDEIDLAGFAAERDQLFAEALVRYEAGEHYWPSKAEQKALFDPVQLKREAAEPLVDALHDWVLEQYDPSGNPKPFSAADAIMEGLHLKADKLTRDMSTRIGIALRKLGCTRIEKRNGMVRYWYVPPLKPENKQYSGQVGSPPAQPDMGRPSVCPF